MILLDTNVVSEMRERRTQIAPQVASWLASIAMETVFLSAVTIFELERGVLRLERRDPAQAFGIRRWIDQGVLGYFADRVLPVDRAIATLCARLQVERSRPELDSFIAATAIVHGLTLATRNIRDFAGTGVRLVNPWNYRVGTGSAPP